MHVFDLPLILNLLHLDVSLHVNPKCVLHSFEVFFRLPSHNELKCIEIHLLWEDESCEVSNLVTCIPISPTHNHYRVSVSRYS